jgi:hypothetical protein
MAYFLFLDESGHDLRDSPSEVLAGICVQDLDVWNLIDAVTQCEERIFGVRYSRLKEEIKGKKFLKKKVFRHAAQSGPILPDERRELAKASLEKGNAVGGHQLTALAQAKLAFVEEVLELSARFHCYAFAAVVPRTAPRPVAQVLRKDYAYLFERFYYFLEDRGPSVQGIVVFDELEKAQSKILLMQMEQYFLHTGNGRTRSRQIIPQPFFVHSDLTTLVQLADLIAYVSAWTWRPDGPDGPCLRPELDRFADQIRALRYRAIRDVGGQKDRTVWSFAMIPDLRGWEERVEEEGKKKRQ